MPRRSIEFSPQERDEFLLHQPKAALATLDRNGYPHVVAMNYLYRDGAIYMTSYAKAQKILNIRRNPKVGVMVEAGKTYGELQGVMIRGECEIIEEPERVREIFRWLGHREPTQTAQVPSGAAQSVIKRVGMRIVPTRFTSWDHTKLGGKY